jgi:uncharacterized protein (UPF0332 family)
MKEIKALVAKAQRYLKSAELLLQDGDYESSVSRTYYAIEDARELLAQGNKFCRAIEVWISAS